MINKTWLKNPNEALSDAAFTALCIHNAHQSHALKIQFENLTDNLAFETQLKLEKQNEVNE